MTIYTTAPRNFLPENFNTETVGVHKLGFVVRKVEVPKDLAYDQITACWLKGHMAIVEDEFPELVERGLITPEVRT